MTKKNKIIFWLLTVPFVAMMLMSAYFSLTGSPQMIEGVQHLGYPIYFAKFLGAAKLLGVIALLYRRFPLLTEWAYAGFTFTMLGASFSHFSSGDELIKILMPLIMLAILLTSYKFSKKI